MVAVKLDELKQDLQKDPLVPRLLPSENKKFGSTVLKATDTSLGGDDGIGVGFYCYYYFR
jgi:hypothetical protein